MPAVDGVVGSAGAVLAIGFWFARRRAAALRTALRRAEDDVQRVAVQASDLVFYTNDGLARIVADRVLGLDAGESAAPVPISSLVHASDVAGFSAALAALTDREVRRDIQLRLVDRHGASVWVECEIGRLDDVDEIVVTARDITKQREEADRLKLALESARDAEQAAEEANRVKSDFLASMSHEIRTPLNAIIGFADLLLDTTELSGSAKRNVERIKAGGDVLLTIVNDILDYSQLESGEAGLDTRPFALPLLIDECVALVERLAVAKNLALRVQMADCFPVAVLGDEGRLRQILLNLINNAIKFTEAGSVVLRIGFDRDTGPDRVMFEVTDTGIGIADKDMPSLFQRFRQVDGTMRRSHGGTGLGLAISKALVERMGGRIGVRSVKGSGSTFWFSLDLPSASLVLEPEQPAVARSAAARLNILLVEDVPINQELARAILEARGHAVDAVDDGAQAILAVEHQAYDLVLMDVQMPHVDGLMATHAIRTLPTPGRFVPIVAMTANVMRDQVAAALAAGMDDVLAKPLNLEAMETLLQRVGRHAISQTPDVDVVTTAVLGGLAREIGDAGVDTALADFVAMVAARFTHSLAPHTFATLQSDAVACFDAARRLGFRRFADTCRRFADAADPTAGDYPAVLRDLTQAVRVTERLRAKYRLAGERRAAA